MPYVNLIDDVYTPISEGQHTFTITKVFITDDLNKITLYFDVDENEKHTERYNIASDGGAKAFSRFVRAIDENATKKFNPITLEGVKFVGVVEHQTNPNGGQPYVHIRDIYQVLTGLQADPDAGEVAEDSPLSDLDDADLPF